MKDNTGTETTHAAPLNNTYTGTDVSSASDYCNKVFIGLHFLILSALKHQTRGKTSK
jgi:hypothetical protein